MSLMILKDLLIHFNIEETLPDYLLDESFNQIFLDGDLSINDNHYKISIKTRQNVIHKMYICPNSKFPIIIISKLPNNSLNGMKFGLNKGDVVYINEL